MESLDNIVFYTIDRAIKTYRQFAQQQLKKNGFEMTVDQWIVLKCILQNPEITQSEIAQAVFKDSASVTRIIALLVKSKYLKSKANPSNRRRVVLTITALGLETLEEMEKVIKKNRKTALKTIKKKDIERIKVLMNQISENCS
ncbi:MAG: MarR family transcriptional regulator [Bacteroidota bacterium]